MANRVEQCLRNNPDVAVMALLPILAIAAGGIIYQLQQYFHNDALPPALSLDSGNHHSLNLSGVKPDELLCLDPETRGMVIVHAHATNAGVDALPGLDSDIAISVTQPPNAGAVGGNYRINSEQLYAYLGAQARVGKGRWKDQLVTDIPPDPSVPHGIERRWERAEDGSIRFADVELSRWPDIIKAATVLENANGKPELRMWLNEDVFCSKDREEIDNRVVPNALSPRKRPRRKERWGNSQIPRPAYIFNRK